MSVIEAKMRLKGLDLSRIGGEFQSNYEARIDYHMDDVDLDIFFKDVKMQLSPGDLITICAFRSNQYEELAQIRQCRIVCGGRKAPKLPLVAIWVCPMFEIPEELGLKKGFENKERRLYVKKEFGGGFTVQDDKGNVIERVKTKAEAVYYIARLNGSEEKPNGGRNADNAL